jgi:hypothetical protein
MATTARGSKSGRAMMDRASVDFAPARKADVLGRQDVFHAEQVEQRGLERARLGQFVDHAVEQPARWLHQRPIVDKVAQDDRVVATNVGQAEEHVAVRSERIVVVERRDAIKTAIGLDRRNRWGDEFDEANRAGGVKPPERDRQVDRCDDAKRGNARPRPPRRQPECRRGEQQHERKARHHPRLIRVEHLDGRESRPQAGRALKQRLGEGEGWRERDPTESDGREDCQPRRGADHREAGCRPLAGRGGRLGEDRACEHGDCPAAQRRRRWRWRRLGRRLACATRKKGVGSERREHGEAERRGVHPAKRRMELIGPGDLPDQKVERCPEGEKETKQGVACEEGGVAVAPP